MEFDHDEQRESGQGDVGGEGPECAAHEPADQNRKQRQHQQLPREHHPPLPVDDRWQQHDTGDERREKHPLEVDIDDAIDEHACQDGDKRPRDESVGPAVPEEPVEHVLDLGGFRGVVRIRCTAVHR